MTVSRAKIDVLSFVLNKQRRAKLKSETMGYYKCTWIATFRLYYDLYYDYTTIIRGALVVGIIMKQNRLGILEFDLHKIRGMPLGISWFLFY